MIRCWSLPAIAGGVVASSSIDAVAADPLPTKILPAALAVGFASCKGQGHMSRLRSWTVPPISSRLLSGTGRVQ